MQWEYLRLSINDAQIDALRLPGTIGAPFSRHLDVFSVVD